MTTFECPIIDERCFRIRFNKDSFTAPHYFTGVSKQGSLNISIFTWWKCIKYRTAVRKVLELENLKPEFKGLLEIEHYVILRSKHGK